MRRVSLFLVLLAAICGTFTASGKSLRLRPENPATLATPLAVYPSAKLPPISQPNMLGFHNVHSTREKMGMVHQWAPHWNLLTNVVDDRRRIDQPNEGVIYCIENGILPLHWILGPMRAAKDRKGDWTHVYVGAARNMQRLGIGLDEWQSGTVAVYGGMKTVNFAAEGLTWAKQAYPEFYQMVFWRGEDNVIKTIVQQKYIDLLMIEGYSYVWTSHTHSIQPYGTMKRVELARKWENLERTMVMLGQVTVQNCKTDPGRKVPGEAEFEEQIQYFRKGAPEMPGIAFYLATNTFKDIKEKLQACDRLFVKYYLEPAPEVTINSPKEDETLSGVRKLLAIAKPKAADNTIIEYLWFIDNRLMARTKESQWNWNTRLEAPGKHIITVQAVDSAYNRGVRQIDVEVK